MELHSQLMPQIWKPIDCSEQASEHLPEARFSPDAGL